MNTLRLGLMLAVLALLAVPTSARAQEQPAPEQLTLTVSDVNMLGLLGAAQSALYWLEDEPSKQQRDIYLATVIDALTGLYQLHGLEWAGGRLAEVYARGDCPELITGYSADGRVYLRVQPLELKNPAFAGSTIMLCQLMSHSPLHREITHTSPLVLTLTDGTQLTGEVLDETHPLWENLDRHAATFAAPRLLPSGVSVAFKQIYSLPPFSLKRVATVSLKWGEYTIELARPQANETGAPAQG